jgi:hypothetical protein
MSLGRANETIIAPAIPKEVYIQLAEYVSYFPEVGRSPSAVMDSAIDS